MPYKSLSREDLYELVWSKPISQFAKDFGLSDRGLAKKCTRMEIPLPGRGYWAKLEHGYPQDKEPLEAPSKTCELSFEYYPTSPETAKGIPLDSDSSVQQAIEYEANPENKIIVPEKVHRYSPVVKKTIDSMGRGRSDELCHSPEDSLALVCTKNTLPRAARIYQALIKAFEQRGHNLSVHYYYPYTSSYEKRAATAVQAFDVYVHISLSEKTDRVPIISSEPVTPFGKKYDYVPNGKLILRIEHPRAGCVRTYWTDTAATPLEEKLNSFVLEVIKVAVFKKHKVEKEEEEERLREERRKRQEEEAARLNHLSKAIEDWETAERVRSFIMALEKSPTSLTFKNMLQQEWAEWVKGYADKIDPFLSGVVVPPDKNFREYRSEHSAERGFWQKWYSTPQSWP
jgi:hypothetical protein